MYTMKKQQRQQPLSRGCLAEASFGSICANLACWEMQDRQRGREAAEETVRHLCGLSGTGFGWCL